MYISRTTSGKTCCLIYISEAKAQRKEREKTTEKENEKDTKRKQKVKCNYNN